MAGRIFIADDDVEMHRMLASALRSAGFRVELSSDGRELWDRLLLAYLDEAPPDLVITDVHMPRASGLQVLQWAQEILPDTPVIVITGFGDGQVRERAEQLGAAAVLDKPLDVRRLRSIAHELVGGGLSRDRDAS